MPALRLLALIAGMRLAATRLPASHPKGDREKGNGGDRLEKNHSFPSSGTSPGFEFAVSGSSFPPPLRGRVREGGAACCAARPMASTTPSRFFSTSSFVNRSTRYPRDTNH